MGYAHPEPDAASVQSALGKDYALAARRIARKLKFVPYSVRFDYELQLGLAVLLLILYLCLFALSAVRYDRIDVFLFCLARTSLGLALVFLSDLDIRAPVKGGICPELALRRGRRR